MLRDEDSQVRIAAVEALGKMMKPGDKKNIIEMLNDEDSEVRTAAIQILIKIADPKERRHLLDLLSDKAQCYGKRQIFFNKILSLLDRAYYCPFPWVFEP